MLTLQLWFTWFSNSWVSAQVDISVSGTAVLAAAADALVMLTL